MAYISRDMNLEYTRFLLPLLRIRSLDEWNYNHRLFR